MAKEVKTIKSAKLKSRVNYTLTFSYDGRDVVLSPGQSVIIADVSKLGKINPTEISKIEVK